MTFKVNNGCAAGVIFSPKAPIVGACSAGTVTIGDLPKLFYAHS